MCVTPSLGQYLNVPWLGTLNAGSWSFTMTCHDFSVILSGVAFLPWTETGTARTTASTATSVSMRLMCSAPRVIVGVALTTQPLRVKGTRGSAPEPAPARQPRRHGAAVLLELGAVAAPQRRLLVEARE